MDNMARLRREVFRTLLAFCFCVGVASCMAWVQLMNDNASLTAQVTRQPSLLDASRRLQGLRWIRPWMADISLYAMVGGSISALLIYFVLWRGRITTALQVTRRFFWLMGCGYALRGLTLFGTILPPSNPQCEYIQRTAVEAALAVPKLLAGSIHTCSDKIFSGHTLVATLLASFWFHLAPPGHYVPRLYAACSWCLMVLCSLSGRHHYTVDIVVGAIVAALLFHLYHLMLKAVKLEEYALPVSMTAPHRLFPGPIRSALVFMDGIDLRDNGGGGCGGDCGGKGNYLPLFMSSTTAYHHASPPTTTTENKTISSS